MRYVKVFVLPFFAVIIYITLVAYNHFSVVPKINNSDSRIYIPPPQNVELMTFGYNESFADFFWIRWVQEPDECGKGRVLRAKFEEEYEGFKNQNKGSYKLKIGFDRSEKKVCPRSWSFLLLDAITKLIPQWRAPYLYGSIFLSVVVDDHEGAEILFDRALRAYPEDWKFHYQAAYHHLFELDNLTRAAQLLNKARELGAPMWVGQMASKLYTKTGQLFLAYSSLNNFYEQYKASGRNLDTPYFRELEEKVFNLKAQLEAQRTDK